MLESSGGVRLVLQSRADFPVIKPKLEVLWLEIDALHSRQLNRQCVLCHTRPSIAAVSQRADINMLLGARTRMRGRGGGGEGQVRGGGLCLKKEES